MKFSQIILLLVLPFMVLFAFSTSRKPDHNDLKQISYFTTNQAILTPGLASKNYRYNYQTTDFIEIDKDYIWIKIDGTSFDDNKKLKINNQLIPKIEHFIIRNNAFKLIDSSGYNIPCNQRSYCHQQFIFDLQPEMNYFRLRNENILTNLRLELRSELTFIRENKSDQIGYGTFYGIFVFFIILNIFLYLQLKDTNYLYNFMFTLILAVSVAVFDGNMSKTIFQNIGFNSYYISHILFQLLLLNHLIFAQRFFNTPSQGNFWKKGFYSLIVFQTILLLASLLHLNKIQLLLNYVSLYTFFAQIIFISILFIIILLNKKHKKRSFIFAYIPVLALVACYVLKVLGVDYFRYNFNTVFYTCIYALVFILAVFIIDSFASYKIEATKRLMEMSRIKNYNNLNLEQKISKETAYLKEQKDLLETKNKELIDSFHYAKRIQNSLLTTEVTIQSYLPKSFLLFEPKEILSTDFYWVTKIQTQQNPNLVLFCIGTPNQTGIPGTLINAIILKTIRNSIHSHKLSNTARVNNYIQYRLDEVLSKNGVNAQNQMLIGVFNPENKQLSFSGNLSFLEIIRKGAPLKTSDYNVHTEQFLHNYSTEEYNIELKASDQIYLFTKGIKDALHAKGKHYFIQYLMHLSLQPVQQQKTMLLETLSELHMERKKDLTFMAITITNDQ